MATFGWDEAASQIDVEQSFDGSWGAPRAAKRLGDWAEAEWRSGQRDEALRDWMGALGLAAGPYGFPTGAPLFILPASTRSNGPAPNASR